MAKAHLHKTIIIDLPFLSTKDRLQQLHHETGATAMLCGPCSNKSTANAQVNCQKLNSKTHW